MNDILKKGGITKLIKIIQFKYPTLNFNKSREYVEKARVMNRDSLIGLRMGELMKLIKGTMKIVDFRCRALGTHQ